MAVKISKEFRTEIAHLLDAVESDTLVGSERVRIAEILRCNVTDNACMVHAAPDEPVFVLRAKDPIAADAAMHWAVMADAQAGDAANVADQMEEWRKKHESKLSNTEA